MSGVLEWRKMSVMDFAGSQEYLYSLGNEIETMKLGLDNIRTLLTALGDPQNNYLKVQVAGTNGKGSVCAFLDSICREAGINAGLYTSPHLVSITERVKIGSFDIGADQFARLATRVRSASEELVLNGELERVPTFFEQVTAIALLAFAEAKVEVAILETGLGGRFDATTAAKAEIAVITRIDLDHQEYLGNTLEEIAAEKAGIIRPRSKVIIVDQSAEAMNVINEFCLDNGVTPAVATDIGVRALGFPPRQLGLAGRHQFENARAATGAAFTLRSHFEIPDEAVAAGLENARHPGRLVRIGDYLLDGAHNHAGAKALRAFLEENERGPITMVFGAMRDKDVTAIARTLWPLAERIVLTRPSNSRAFTAEELLPFAPSPAIADRAVLTESVDDALRSAADAAKGGLVVVTGSLYLVGEVTKLIDN